MNLLVFAYTWINPISCAGWQEILLPLSTYAESEGHPQLRQPDASHHWKRRAKDNGKQIGCSTAVFQHHCAMAVCIIVRPSSSAPQYVVVCIYSYRCGVQ